MGIIKVLKRKDAASVVVAIVVGMVLYQLVTIITSKWAGDLTGLDYGEPASAGLLSESWKGQYLYPGVSAALQLLALEVLVWVYVLIAGVFKKK